MAITSFTKQPISDFGGTTYLVTAGSDLAEPTFYFWLEGELAQEGPLDSMQVTVQEGESVDLQVFDDAEARPTDCWPGRAWLCVEEVADAVAYRFDKYEDAAWTQQRKLPDLGQSWFEYQTKYLEDDTEHVFRAVAESAAGNESAAREFRFLWVRRPDAVEVDWSFDSGTGLTASFPE